MDTNEKEITAVNSLVERLDYFSIGEKATSYKCPLTCIGIKEYNGFLCIETKNIKGYYITFEKTALLEALKKIT